MANEATLDELLAKLPGIQAYAALVDGESWDLDQAFHKLEVARVQQAITKDEYSQRFAVLYTISEIRRGRLKLARLIAAVAASEPSEEAK